MSALVLRVVRELREHRLAGAGDRVAVALSGGPDSVALALLLSEALPTVGASLVGAAHFHHGLRGADADADEGFCRDFAASRGLPILVEHAELGLRRANALRSPEALAHDVRYAFYERACQALGATRIATGHTSDDLAETVLLRLFRGAGLRGLGGIRAVNGRVIRPLLEATRAEVVAFLQLRDQPFREDASNADVRIPRNRIRHEILPLLERHAGPCLSQRLARAARLMADDDALLNQAATREADRVVQQEGATTLVLDVDKLTAVPRALQRRIVLRALERVGSPPSAATVDRVLGMVTLRDGARLDLARLSARRSGRHIVFARPGEPRVRGSAPDPRVAQGKARSRGLVQDDGVVEALPAAPANGLLPAPETGAAQSASNRELVGLLQVPGRLSLPGGGHIEVERRDRSEVVIQGAGRDTAVIDAAVVRLPLAVRFRLAGDRLRPLGMRGVKKLQDLFVDRKVPRAERDLVPLVVDRDDRILWVAGHVIANDAHVSSATSSVLLFQYRR